MRSVRAAALVQRRPDGAPTIKRALEIMAQSYRKLGMDDLAADSEKVLKENYANVDKVGEEKKSWWKFW
jgi:outer membrane protein assembly factor BamD